MQYGKVAMETRGSAKFKQQIIKKIWQTVALLCQTDCLVYVSTKDHLFKPFVKTSKWWWHLTFILAR